MMKKRIRVFLVILVCAICSVAIYMARPRAKPQQREEHDRSQTPASLVTTTAPLAISSQEHQPYDVAGHSASEGTAATATSTQSAISNNTLMVDGISYESAAFGEVTNNLVIIAHKAGTTAIPLQRLSPELQKHFDYDPQKDEYFYILLPVEEGRIWYLPKKKSFTLGPPGS